MKYIKTYEESTDDLQLGDYVICIPINMMEGAESFFENNIGKFVKYQKKTSYLDECLCVEYDEIPYKIQHFYCTWREKDGKLYLEKKIWFTRDMIKYYGKTKEEVELKKSSKKYNL